MKTIKEEWLDFKDRIVSKTAGRTQINEMELSFYAGTISTLVNIKSTANGENTTKEAVNYLISIEEEAVVFFEQWLDRKKGKL